MAKKIFINLLYFIFLFFIVKPSLNYCAHLHSARSLQANSPQTNEHHSLPLSSVKNLIGTQKGNEAKGIMELKKYLSNLGYMTGVNESNIFDDNLELALKKYQLFYKLKETGIMDNETTYTLLKSRCGVPDIFQDERRLDNKNPLMVSYYTFLPNNPKWPPTKKILTYSFQPGTRGDIVQPIARAVARWASVTRFKFNYIKDYEQADIKISFQIGDHGDGHPFDGSGPTVAHAFGPPDGRLHYDASEQWVDGVAPGYVDLQTVGLHELGHVLGLGHSTDPNAIMYAYVPPNTRKDLSQDDIDGVRAIYQL